MQCQKRTDTTYGCPVIGRREVEKSQQVHRAKLQSIRSALDTRAPSAQPHLTLYGRDYVSKKRATTEAAFSDLKMIQTIAKTMTRQHHVPERKGPVTLNTDQRKHEIYRVMKENHKLLEHIEHVEPWIKSSDMVREHRMNHRYVINASHTMRLSGDYDDAIAQFRRLDQTQVEQTRRSTQARLMHSSGGSVSLPSLSPNGGRESPDGKGNGKGTSVAACRTTPPAAKVGGHVERPRNIEGGSAPSSSSSRSLKGKAGGRGQGAPADENAKIKAETIGAPTEAPAEELAEDLAVPELQAAAELLLSAAGSAAPQADVSPAPEANASPAAAAAAPETLEVPTSLADLHAKPEEANASPVAAAAALETLEESRDALDLFAKQEAETSAAEEASLSKLIAEVAHAPPPVEVPAATQEEDEYEDGYEEESMSLHKQETHEPFEESAGFEDESAS